MSKIRYEQMADDAVAHQKPPPYSERQPYDYPPDGTAASSSHEAPTMLHQYQTSQTIIIRTVQPVNEPDYLAYSIFTMLCCCLPLGIAALVYSIQTQKANSDGNSTTARQNSRCALRLAHSAVGVGIGFLIMYIIFWVYAYSEVSKEPQNLP